MNLLHNWLNGCVLVVLLMTFAPSVQARNGCCQQSTCSCCQDLCRCQKNTGCALCATLYLDMTLMAKPDLRGEDASATFDEYITCTPKVNTPSGCTIRGQPQIMPLIYGIQQLNMPAEGTLIVCDAECGTYHFGWDIDICEGWYLAECILSGEVVSNCTSPERTRLPPVYGAGYTGDVSTMYLLDGCVQMVLPYIFAPECCIRPAGDCAPLIGRTKKKAS